MYFDWTYLVLVLPMVIISLIAQAKVTSTYKKYNKVICQRGFTADAAVRQILDRNGLYDVRIARIPGDLTDNYNPETKVISLSESVYGSSSIAAIGVAAHEAGHAVQHAEEYAPLKLRNTMVPVTQFGAKLSTPLIILGIILGFYYLAYAGIILFGLVVLFQLITLPTEFNASRRAINVLSSGILSDEELKGTKKVLSAAAMTYVAATLVSLASLLRFVIIVSGGRSNRR